MFSIEKMEITETGKVTITADGILVEDFSGKNASCRDVANMATTWAIGELQRELLKNIQEPGGGNICIG